MRRRWSDAIVLFLCLIPFVIAQQHTPDQLQPIQGIIIPKNGTSIPMLDWGHRPVVEVLINGRGPYRFILDTGASVTLVDSSLAKELSLPAVPISASGADSREADESSVFIRELGIGNATLKEISVTAAPVRRMFANSENAPVGVLSAASFSGYLLVLDYPARQIAIQEGELGPSDGRRIFDYAPDAVLPTVPIRIGAHQFVIHVDTGSPGSLMLPTKYMGDISLAGDPVEVGRARTASGESRILAAPINDDVELGEFHLNVSRVSFSDLQMDPGFEQQGTIGFEILSTFVVTLDSKERRLRFEKGIPSKASGSGSLENGRLAEYAGVYGDRTFSIQAGDLYIQRPGGAKLKMVPIRGEKDAFTLEEIPKAKLVFERGADGNIVAVRVLNLQGQWEMSKKN